MGKRQVYLEDIPLEEAVARWWAALEEAGATAPLPGEPLPVAEALGRVTAEAVWARLSSPHYHAAAMDGYAVRAEDTRGATETTPLRLRVGTQAIPVDTGDPLPPGTNAVIKIEDTQLIAHHASRKSLIANRLSQVAARPSSIEILASVAPWQHVRPMGEDMVASELVLPANHRLRPQDLGAIVGSGHTTVSVRRRPRVAILPTGTELVPPGSEPRPGEIVEYNSIMLAAKVEEWGGEPTRLPPVPDDFEAIKDSVATALDTHDLVVVNAGSSAGSEDYTADVFRELGQVFVHGIAIRPGHPVVLGLARGKPVMGIPGYPVSALLTFDLLAGPLIARWLGQPAPPRPLTLQATLTRKVFSPAGEEEFLRVAVGQVEERLVATPLPRGAGVLMSLVRADGLVRIPRFSQGYDAGDTVTVELLRPSEAIRRSIVVIGSHDLTLDLLADRLAQHHPGLRLTSAHVGSLGGLLALQRNEAHLAGSHLLDEKSGEYNVDYVRRLLPGRRIVLLGFVTRLQGLIVLPGNPKAIRSLDDLTREDVSFINRQRGSGTRVLLDYELKRRSIDPRHIQGYERQEFTHLAVAAAVQSGTADCGLGILAAARALGLDFVPLLEERYDLVIPAEHYESELLQPLLALIRKPEFGAAVEALGGYSAAQMGRVLAKLEEDGNGGTI
ncbi:MAG: molybdopterin biosynthesis protein [Anaerolineae bacterium]|nr:molybdopterin biosynthesis protein [Anaerolineae bacterium]